MFQHQLPRKVCGDVYIALDQDQARSNLTAQEGNLMLRIAMEEWTTIWMQTDTRLNSADEPEADDQAVSCVVRSASRPERGRHAQLAHIQLVSLHAGHRGSIRHLSSWLKELF